MPQLNPEQQAAVKLRDGRICVIAGAGSGKTKVLVDRIADMVKSGVHPESILAFTFTRKAAEEMKERIRLAVTEETFEMAVGTIHSTLFGILKEHLPRLDPRHYGRGMPIAKDWQIKKILQEIHKEYGFNKDWMDEVEARRNIGRAKNMGFHPPDFEEHLVMNEFSDEVINYRTCCFSEYEERKTRQGLIDFDDMLLITRDIFKTQPDVLAKYQNRWQYVSVDEYQDINPVQAQVIEMLTAKHGNLFVVGDARQCVVGDTPIQTAGGYKLAKDIREGDHVVSACGNGQTDLQVVEKVMSRKHSGVLYEIGTKGGSVLKLTGEHTCFAGLPRGNTDHVYLYLMKKDGLGFRIGTTAALRWHNANAPSANGLKGRLTQEGGDAIWILEVCNSEANKYSEIKNLFVDYELSEENPHYRPIATTQGNSQRSAVTFAAFSGKRAAARVGISSSHLPWRLAKKGWRIEKCRASYDEGLELAEELSAATGFPIRKTACLVKDGKAFGYFRACDLRRGMIVPVYTHGALIEDEIVSIQRLLSSQVDVYDFSVSTNRNFVAGGICIHNCIYQFRASEPSFILNFRLKYPDAQIVRLHRNYRCGSTILHHANMLIANNDEGKEPMRAEVKEEGDVVVMEPFYNKEDEAEGVIEEIVQRVYDGSPYKEFAVLYRCNHQSRAIEDSCIRHKVPYEIIGSEGFYGRTEIKDLTAYMAIVRDMDELTDRSAMERVVNRPTRYLGKKFIEEWHGRATAQGPVSCLTTSGWSSINRRSEPNVRMLHSDLSTLHDKYLSDPVGFVRYIREEMGYDKWFLDNRSGEAMEEVEALSNLTELSASAENFKSVGSMHNYILDIVNRHNEDGDSKANKIKLMSLHRAKGLEFPVVFITGVSEELLPHRKVTDHTEERRLLYVGVTRAKQRLYLSYYQLYRDRIVDASRFFAEMGFAMDRPDLEWDGEINEEE